MFCPKIIFGLGSISVSAERAEVVQHLCIYILNLSKRIHISPAFLISDDLTDKFQWPKSQQKIITPLEGKGKCFETHSPSITCVCLNPMILNSFEVLFLDSIYDCQLLRILATPSSDFHTFGSEKF